VVKERREFASRTISHTQDVINIPVACDDVRSKMERRVKKISLSVTREERGLPNGRPSGNS